MLLLDVGEAATEATVDRYDEVVLDSNIILLFYSLNIVFACLLLNLTLTLCY